MKKFKGHLSVEEVKKAARARGFAVDSSRYDDLSIASDWITVRGSFGGESLEIIYSDWNGRFIGKRGGEYFSEADGGLDDEPWYAEILDFFYPTADVTA